MVVCCQINIIIVWVQLLHPDTFFLCLQSKNKKNFFASSIYVYINDDATKIINVVCALYF